MLPAAVMTLIGAFGWRWSMGIMGAVILLVFLPVVLRLMRGTGVPALTNAAARAGGKSAARTLLAGPASRAVLLVFLVPPFALTGLFLYQALLCEYKGWPPAVMAGGFAAFAAARFTSSLAAGTLIDTLGAARLLRFYLLPFIAGLAVVYLADGPWAAAAFMALCGFTTGPGEAIQTALWSDLYGAEVIGGIKGFTSMLSVVGTAAAPLFAGYLIQSGGGVRDLPAQPDSGRRRRGGNSLFAGRFRPEQPLRRGPIVSVPAKELFNPFKLIDPPAFRYRAHKSGSVAFCPDPGIKHDNRAEVRFAADEPAESLAEFYDRPGKDIFVKDVHAFGRHPFISGFFKRSVRGNKWQPRQHYA